MLPAYAELHCLSNFSFLRGASHPEELVERAQALGYAALAITDECSLAGVVRAHVAAKTRRPEARDRQRDHARRRREARAARDRSCELRQSRAAHHARAAPGEKGQLRAVARRRRRRSQAGCSRCGCRDDGFAADDVDDAAERARTKRLLTARWVAATFPGRAWIAVELFARAGERARLARCAELSRGDRAAAGRRRRRAHARARAARAAGHADRDPPAQPIAECGHALLSQRRAAPALARAARDDLSAGAARRDRRDRRALHVLARRAALRISRGDRAARRHAGVAPARAHRGRARAALSGRGRSRATSAS